MPIKGPTTSLTKIQREAAEYQAYMVRVYMGRGMDEAQARECASAACTTQLAIRMRELERKREARIKAREGTEAAATPDLMKDVWALRERDVTGQVTDFLKWRGWRLIRNNVTKMKDRTGRWTSYGENGMPDYTALYYLPDEKPGLACVIWLELKKPKGKPAPAQLAWRRAGAGAWRVRGGGPRLRRV